MCSCAGAGLHCHKPRNARCICALGERQRLFNGLSFLQSAVCGRDWLFNGRCIGSSCSRGAQLAARSCCARQVMGCTWAAPRAKTCVCSACTVTLCKCRVSVTVLLCLSGTLLSVFVSAPANKVLQSGFKGFADLEACIRVCCSARSLDFFLGLGLPLQQLVERMVIRGKDTVVFTRPLPGAPMDNLSQVCAWG